MKSTVLAVLLLIGTQLFAQQFAPGIAELERKSFSTLHTNNQRGAIVNNNITQVRLEITVDPSVNYINGKVTTTFIALEEMDAIEFDLRDTMQVDSVIYHGVNIPLTYHHADIVHIDLPITIAVGVKDSIAIYYQGAPGQTGFGSFIVSEHDSVPVVWTLSEPYGAKDWWPCKQNLSDKIDSLDVLITTPAQYRAASNGLLVEEITNGAVKTYQWKHRYPIAAYLVCMAATNYMVYSNYVPFGNDTLQVLNYVYPEHLEDAQQGTQMIVQFVQLFDSLFGEYPFQNEKYGHAEFGWGGGMEHQTMTFVTGFGFELLSHELGHHWFGDKVTCASWRDIWLNEGFATYLSGLCYEHIAPQYDIPYKQIKLNQIISQPDGSVYCYDTSSVSRLFSGNLTYSKGGMVLNMLRWVLGDSAFFGGVRNYLYDVNNAYAFATTPELQQHLQAASGKDLTNYFDTWVYKEGFPSYHLNWKQDFDGNTEIMFNQTWSHPSVDFYGLPVPIQFKGNGVDTLMVFNNTEQNQSFTFQLPFLADTIVIDPKIMLISGNNTIMRNAAYDFSMLIYPNPISNLLQVKVESSTAKQSEVQVVDMSGKIVAAGSYILQQGANNIAINMQGMAKGVYTLKVKSGNDMITGKFIKSGK